MNIKMITMMITVGVTFATLANRLLVQEGTSLSQWRMAMATNGYVAVKGRAKVPQDVRESIWKAYREHIGIEGIQMSKPTLVATNECGNVYDLPFTTSEGTQQNLGVKVTKGIAWPLYVTGAGQPPRNP